MITSKTNFAYRLTEIVCLLRRFYFMYPDFCIFCQLQLTEGCYQGLNCLEGEFCSVNLLASTDILLLAFSIEQVIIDSIARAIGTIYITI